jgi:hypothetical protein
MTTLFRRATPFKIMLVPMLRVGTPRRDALRPQPRRSIPGGVPDGSHRPLDRLGVTTLLKVAIHWDRWCFSIPSVL